jgi:uncharacterized protein (TIGR00297 family)
LILEKIPLLNPLQLSLGLLMAVIVSWLAWRAHSLNLSGAAAAAVLGTVVFGIGGLSWAVLLLGFFITSSGLSRVAGKRKEALNEKFSKGSRRDAAQVMANGGMAGVFVLLYLLLPDAVWPWFAFAGTLAAVNADTWATELGVLSRRMPHLITNGKSVERGTSGGVTILGTLAAASGALVIGLLAAVVRPDLLARFGPGQAAGMVLALMLAGTAGSLFDSLLGATVQAIYTCPTCQKETERHPTHTCGSDTILLRGWVWLNNDWVNTACALVGAGLGVLAVMLL